MDRDSVVETMIDDLGKQIKKLEVVASSQDTSKQQIQSPIEDDPDAEERKRAEAGAKEKEGGEVEKSAKVRSQPWRRLMLQRTPSWRRGLLEGQLIPSFCIVFLFSL